jgi:hypothetical protein
LNLKNPGFHWIQMYLKNLMYLKFRLILLILLILKFH